MKPPYAVISAVNLDRGELQWQVPYGETPDAVRNHPALKGMNIPNTGQPGSVGLLVTKALVVLGEVRGLGPMIGLELVEDPATRDPAPTRTRRVLDLARERGLLLLRSGTHDNVVRLLAPLVTSEADLALGLDILAASLEDALA